MANIVEVRVTAFINDDWILFSATPTANIYFEGNNRGFTYWTENQANLFKMAQHAVVDFQNKSIKVFNAVGPTRQMTVYNATGQITYNEGQTDTSKMDYSTSFDTYGNAKIWLKGSSENPRVNLAPTIDWDYYVTVTPTGQVTITGKHDGYPNHEIYKRVNSGTPVEMYRFNKQTIASLYDPMEHSVSVVK